MGTNDFASVKQVLSEAFVLEWPQSNELIRGPEKFVRLNAEYPAFGPWVFEVKRLVASPNEVVTHVAVTDGKQVAEAVSFFEVVAGRITRVVEYWPESYAPPGNRAHIVEPLHRSATGDA